jgi:hypothetical protein
LYPSALLAGTTERKIIDPEVCIGGFDVGSRDDGKSASSEKGKTAVRSFAFVTSPGLWTFDNAKNLEFVFPA